MFEGEQKNDLYHTYMGVLGQGQEVTSIMYGSRRWILMWKIQFARVNAKKENEMMYSMNTIHALWCHVEWQMEIFNLMNLLLHGILFSEESRAVGRIVEERILESHCQKD